MFSIKNLKLFPAKQPISITLKFFLKIFVEIPESLLDVQSFITVSFGYDGGNLEPNFFAEYPYKKNKVVIYDICRLVQLLEKDPFMIRLEQIDK